MADNEETIEQHYTDAFEANLGLLPQVRGGRLINLVDSNLAFTKPGDMFNADDVGPSDPEDIEDRFGKSPEGTIARRRRVGFFTPYDDGKFLDDIDTAKSLSDPANATMQSMMAGHLRHRDKEIIRALDAPAREGRTGEEIVAFPGTQSIAVDNWSYKRKGDSSSGNSSLTFAKINHAKVKLDKSEIEGERVMLYNSEMLAQLLTDPTITDRESGVVQALISGEIHHFMGFTWQKTELLPLASAGVRKTFAFIKPAVMYRARTLTAATITRRSDRKFNWYAYYKGTHGAARRHDEAVVRILCAE